MGRVPGCWDIQWNAVIITPWRGLRAIIQLLCSTDVLGGVNLFLMKLYSKHPIHIIYYLREKIRHHFFILKYFTAVLFFSFWVDFQLNTPPRQFVSQNLMLENYLLHLFYGFQWFFFLIFFSYGVFRKTPWKRS